jgi:hypothetical protein
LNFQTHNLNDTVINLNVCHGHPPLREQRDGQSSAVTLTALGVHVSMISLEFSNDCRWHLPLIRCLFTVLIITKEAFA